MLTLAVLV